jgi:ABC-type glycerol-3-phosphate transport system substrate-binding protein
MSNGQNTANILAALSAAAQLAPVAASLIGAAQAAVTEGRDLTDDELQAAVSGNQAASDALDAAIAATKG